MKAMILAAGLGTRLRPLSFTRPKVLTPFWGVTMLEYWIAQLARRGVEAAIVNACHLSGQVLDAIQGRSWPIPVEVSLERTLLGTGGGIRYALDFFGSDPFLVINGDILCTLDLASFHARHVDSGALVSLALHDHAAFNNVAVLESRQVLGFGREARGIQSDSPAIELLAFTGIHCLHREAVAGLRRGEPADILDVYRHLIAVGRPPRADLAQGFEWREMGSIGSYVALHAEWAGLPPGAHPPFATGSAVCIHPSSTVGEGAVLAGYVVMGENCRVEAGALLEDAILWDDVTVKAGAVLRRCVAGDGTFVSGSHQDEVLVGRGPESECAPGGTVPTG